MGFVGDWSTRIVTLALPRPSVERMLARERRLGRVLELLPQGLTPEGSHPVLFSFGTLHRSRMSWSSAASSSLTYEEMAVVVPFVASRRRSARTGTPPPRVYLPRLFLNATVPTVGGWLYWGFNKVLARIRDTQEEPGRYDVRSLVAGTPLLSLRWEAPTEPYQPVSEVPAFQAMREIHEQSLLGTVGPLLTSAPWTKDWSQGTVRGLSAELRLSAPFVPGLELGHHTCAPLRPDHVLGAYQLRVPFVLSLPRLEP
ncbi:acetoacetate decarboxylase family protein [Cystobacter fuscus]